jgi:hypothetical protein
MPAQIIAAILDRLDMNFVSHLSINAESNFTIAKRNSTMMVDIRELMLNHRQVMDGTR